MEESATVEVAPQAPKVPGTHAGFDAAAIRNAQDKLQSAMTLRPNEAFERIPSADYQKLAKTFIHAEPGQVAKDPLRAAFFIWGAYAIETLLLHLLPLRAGDKSTLLASVALAS